ncbi:T9SS type A sorting domain-containing protein [Dinghuibacter silviterrae]|uniref:Putative secreted protein (Por secretion system target) n=1 Tax=Dinghuibacter silviterrae TaxID=1539049 RepID=A0A4R8DG94_9BACT|nr:T9SS type A sorting domain-containing protein [Dinghuibacter silviterrae]TDW96505.1 putative secreted protein (Por secretion system target) [Dinghuibacter silviterrae]
MTKIIQPSIFAAAVMALLVSAGAASAQSLPGPAWYVVASGGGSDSIPYKGWGLECRYTAVEVSYTVGEPCIAFDHLEKFDVTEGFQQPDGYGVKPYDPFDAIESLTFYPNPCHQFGFVQFYLNESFTQLHMKVFEMNGKCVYEDDFKSGDGKVTYQLPTSHLSPGVYIVQIVGFTSKRYIGKLVVIP